MMKKLFITLPATDDEILDTFVEVKKRLNPESLCNDDKATSAEICKEVLILNKAWELLEEILGRKVTGREIEKYEYEKKKEN